MRVLINARTVVLILWLSCLESLCLFGSHSLLHGAEVPNDAVSFFKRALTSPADVSHFEAGMRDLGGGLPLDVLPENAKVVQQPAQLFEGARSGSNYYIIDKSPLNPTISGRQGQKAFNIGSNSVAYGYEGFKSNDPKLSDRVSQAADSYFRMTRQFLQMGLGEIAPQSTTWLGSDTFVATNDLGVPEYGKLELSNNIPRRLLVSWQEGASPFKTFDYFYPEPLLSLGGSPYLIVLNTLLKTRFVPALELRISKLEIAKNSLSAEYFDAEQFLTPNTIYTSVFSHDEFTGISPRGKVKVKLKDMGNGFVDLKPQLMARRIVLYGCFISFAGLAFFLLLRYIKPK